MPDLDDVVLRGPHFVERVGAKRVFVRVPPRNEQVPHIDLPFGEKLLHVVPEVLDQFRFGHVANRRAALSREEKAKDMFAFPGLRDHSHGVSVGFSVRSDKVDPAPVVPPKGALEADEQFVEVPHSDLLD
jgi:hypothetical protein